MPNDGPNEEPNERPGERPNGRSSNAYDRLRLSQRAQAAVAVTVRAGAERYDRQRDLPRLIRIDPGSTADGEAEAEAIVGRLARALRAERHRARSGHWTYDLNRHIALRQAYLAESERLAAHRRGAR